MSRRKYDAFHDELDLQPITLETRTPILGTSLGHHALYQHCRCNVPQVPGKIQYALQGKVLKDTNISILVLDCFMTSMHGIESLCRNIEYSTSKACIAAVHEDQLKN